MNNLLDYLCVQDFHLWNGEASISFHPFRARLSVAPKKRGHSVIASQSRSFHRWYAPRNFIATKVNSWDRAVTHDKMTHTYTSIMWLMLFTWLYDFSLTSAERQWQKAGLKESVSWLCDDPHRARTLENDNDVASVCGDCYSSLTAVLKILLSDKIRH